MKKRNATRLACLLLSLAMLVGLIPASVFATDDEIHAHTHAVSDQTDEIIENAPATIADGAYENIPAMGDVWDGSIADSFGDGSGTETDPYLIYTAEELAYLAAQVNSGISYSGCYFKLMSNIDLAGLEWSPIGKGELTYDFYTATARCFSGTFDGDFHTVYNLYISNTPTSHTGLFGDIRSCTIRNLGIENAYIYSYMGNGHRTKVGALVGRLSNSLIEGCYAKGVDLACYSTDEPASVGGLVGNIIDSAVITGCYAEGRVQSNGHAAMLIGSQYSSTVTITGCYAVGNVYINGIVADSSYKCASGIISYGAATISSTFFSGTVTNNHNSNTGSIFQHSSGTLSKVYYSCNNVSVTLGISTAAENFYSQQWITDNMGWDFGAKWTFDVAEGYAYPVLQGFGIADHDHEFNASGDPVEPTCNTDGYQLYACTCGYSYKGDLVQRLGHMTDEWIIDKVPTCTESGSRHTECFRCGSALENVYMPALGHSYTSEVTREATCTEPGIITHTCSACSDSYVTYVYSEHSYVMTEYVEAGCEVDGYYKYECERCDAYYTEDIPGGHSYVSEITKPASKEEDGEITYTCEKCQDSYTSVIPKRPEASILLVQDKFPWSEKSNGDLLDSLVEAGYITGWDTASSSSLEAIALSDYKVILIANDQSSSTYANLEKYADLIESYVRGGGVVIYGASDSGWSGGKINYALPGGVTKGNYYSNRNYIVNSTHNAITGLLTDGKGLTDELLYGTYASHAYFTDLPENAVTILADANGRATLVEYQLGDGYVIASGLTWEYSYKRNLVGSSSFAKTAYDDLILYAAMLSNPCDHVWDGGETVEPSCESEGYVLHTCESCGGTMKNSFTDKLAHTPGEWTVKTEATAESEGLREIVCTECKAVLESEVIPALGAAFSKVESDGEISVGKPADFTVTVANAEHVNKICVSLLFDTSLYELVDVEWLVDCSLVEFDEDTMTAIAYFDSLVSPNGAVLKITLKPKAAVESATVDAGVYMSNGNSEFTTTVIPSNNETKPCLHEQMSFVNSGDFHMTKCELCGAESAAVHAYTEQIAEIASLAKDATCTDAPLYYYTCTCGAVGTETFSYGEKPDGTHTYGEWTVTVIATPSHGGEREHTCLICGDTEIESTDALDPITMFDIACILGDTIIGKKGATSLILNLINIIA